MVRVLAFFHHRPYFCVGQGQLSKPSLTIPCQRSLAFHINPLWGATPLKDSRVVLMAKDETQKPSLKETLELWDQLAEKGKKQLKFEDHDKIGLIGPPPDSIEGMIAWRYLEVERIQRNLEPERRKKIEKAALEGDPYFQTELKKIQEYERKLSEKNDN